MEQQVGRLFIVPASSEMRAEEFAQLKWLVHEKGVSGIIWMAGEVAKQKAMMAELSALAPHKLMHFQDAENGIGMRMKGVDPYPKMLTLGALRDLSLIEEVGNAVGLECRDSGIHINLAPVVDVNTNPLNPVIGMRAFGILPEEVVRRSSAFLRGMTRTGTLATLKHFPGHGDTSVDSHLDLPILFHSWERLEEIEFLPYRHLLAEFQPLVMMGHIGMAAVYPDEGKLPSSLSASAYSLLRHSMDFQGCAISDALNMQALTNYYPAEEIAYRACLAGCDLLLYADRPELPSFSRLLFSDIPQAIAKLTAECQADPALQAMLEEKLMRIEAVRWRVAALKRYLALPVDKAELKQRLFNAALTLVKNEHELLPLSPGQKVGYFAPSGVEDPLREELAKELELVALDGEMDLAIIPIFAAKLSEEQLQLEAALRTKQIPVVYLLFATPYALPLLKNGDAILVGYENDLYAKRAAAKILLGTLAPQGLLPIDAYPLFPYGTGLSW